MPTDQPTACEWMADENGNWFTECDNAFTFIDGTPVENGMAFCCYCGRKLVEVTSQATDLDAPEPEDSVA